MIPETASALSRCLTAKSGYRSDAETETFVAHTLRGQGFDASEDGTGRGTPIVAFQAKASAQQSCNPGLVSPSLDVAKSGVTAIAFHENQRGELTVNDTAGALTTGGGKPGQGYPAIAFQTSQSGTRTGETHATLDANNGSRRHNDMVKAMTVRRLTPRECERLQGFPDDWTLIPYRNGMASDSPRYKAIGNSMAVPVIRWIGRRIAAVDAATRSAAA